ncbi:MAG: DUF393 domain-containing protein [Pseudomonadota bacterium]
MAHPATSHGLTVYFDGSCPLCLSEINFYRARRGADAIDWVDVSAARGSSAAADLSCADAMSRFHVRLADGRLLDGGAAFAALWRALPAFRLAGLLFSAPPLRWVLNVAYDLFLPMRPRLQAAAAKRARRREAASRPR